MSKHAHKPACAHKDLKYCKKCDVVECQKCEKEFGKKETIVERDIVPVPYTPAPVTPFTPWGATSWICSSCGCRVYSHQYHQCTQPWVTFTDTGGSNTITMDVEVSNTGLGSLSQPEFNPFNS